MPIKKFSAPIHVTFPGVSLVKSAKEAAQLLMDVRWPKSGSRHRDATDTCLKVLEGHRSTADAERAFVEAAREAGILVDR